MPDLVMRAGALYRNPVGAELRAVEYLHSAKTVWMIESVYDVKADPFGSLGRVWVMRSDSGPFGEPRLLLATPEGLASCGYRLVEGPAEATYECVDADV